MRRFIYRAILVLSLIIEISLLTSCKKREQVFYVTERIKYYEAPVHYNIGDVKRHFLEFKPMSKDQRENFYSVMEDPNHYLWLRIDFVIPTAYRHKDLAFYIPQLHSASRVYLNDKFIKQYGEFPPNEQGAGFQSQIYLFPKETLYNSEKNTIFIQCWPGVYGALYGDVCLGIQDNLQRRSEIVTYHNSRITLIFSGILILMFFIYTFLYYVMKKYETNKEYLYYSLTLLYTFHFLVPFFLPEISWIKTAAFPYLWILKIFGGIGAITTIYFANSFILTYINYKATIKNTAPRLALYLVSAVGILCIPNYVSFTRLFYIFGFISLLQFVHTIRQLVKAFFDPSKNRNACMLLIGFSPVLISIVVDVFVRIIKDSKSSPYYTIYGWQFTIIIFLLYLLVRFSRMYTHNMDLRKQLEDVNIHLEDLVAIRTKELSDANYSLSTGLETVSHVQHNFLPHPNRSFRGWDLAVYYKALDNEVSGDLYDYYYTNGTLDGVGLFDVSGHGISAGLMTILAKGIISQQFKSDILNQEPVSDILKSINKNYIKEKVNVENYITGVLFHFGDFNDKDVCDIEMANAGHPYPLLYNSELNTIMEIKHTDTEKQYGFLGIDGMEVSFPSIYFTAKQNDIIVCFTDGLTESTNPKGEEFSKNRVIEIIQQYKNNTAEEIRNRLQSELEEFTNHTNLEDDVSFIVLKRTATKDYIEEI